jgi:hypothetical protein
MNKHAYMPVKLNNFTHLRALLVLHDRGISVGPRNDVWNYSVEHYKHVYYLYYYLYYYIIMEEYRKYGKPQ